MAIMEVVTIVKLLIDAGVGWAEPRACGEVEVSAAPGQVMRGADVVDNTCMWSVSEARRWRRGCFKR